MKRHWAYLKYVLRHKLFVALVCCKKGLLWRGLVHDWHKLRPSELDPTRGFSTMRMDRSARSETRPGTTNPMTPGTRHLTARGFTTSNGTTTTHRAGSVPKRMVPVNASR